jgi:hypothetical protein
MLLMPSSLHRLSKEQLLDIRFCDLGLGIEGTWLEEPIEIVSRELEARGIEFQPHYWLADEWFSPDGVPGVAIPFYLAHTRLTRLESTMMFEVEGSTRSECLRLLRHEMGHALDTAYGLHRRRTWQRIFGKNSQPYPDYYRPRPSSKRFVQHLDGWYAQSHPAEDFAETFAVWLRRGSNWRTRYIGWPALKKLEYVDELMEKVASERPKVRSRARPYSLSKLRHSLRTHYDRKRAHYDIGYSEAYDRDLVRLFSGSKTNRKRPTAASFLRKYRREIRELVATWTGEYEFTLDQILKEMIGRCRELKLRLGGSEARAKVDFAIMLAVHTVHYLHRGDEWHPV